MHYLTLVIPLLVVVALLFLMGRARRRQATGLSAQADRIVAGTQVMTTSGLYGTVVARNDDGTALLSIAPGVEVRWEVAALRDVASLPRSVGGGLRDASSPYDPPAGRDGDVPLSADDDLPGPGSPEPPASGSQRP